MKFCVKFLIYTIFKITFNFQRRDWQVTWQVTFFIDDHLRCVKKPVTNYEPVAWLLAPTDHTSVALYQTYCYELQLTHHVTRLNPLSC